MLSGAINDQPLFVTLVRTAAGRSAARLLIESIRSFGGALSQCPVWIFEADPHNVPCDQLRGPNQEVIPLSLSGVLGHYPFAHKVCACAQAEQLVGNTEGSLIWVAPACLILNPPVLFRLDQSVDTAVRPVHIRNVGSPIAEPLDRYWEGICRALGVNDIQTAVESFIDRQQIRSYFNTHAFSVNASRGLLTRWAECFEALVGDGEYQTAACQDDKHQIFLHQAVLSALLATSLPSDRIRILPPDYNYPYNLHQAVPADRQPAALNDLVCIAYEDRSLDPSRVDDIAIRLPLRSWLQHHIGAGAPPAQTGISGTG